MTAIEVCSRAPGAESAIPSVWLSLADRTTCVRALIHQAVAAQVAALATAPDEGRAALDRHYPAAVGPTDGLGPDGGIGSGDGIEPGVGSTGRIGPGVKGARVDAATEAVRACRAFERGAFVVFAGGEQREDLDVPFALPADGRVTFLRLTPLVGG